MTEPLCLDELRVHFQKLFGATPRYFQAPGRVNLIGEHTDYNEGFVLPAAIDFRTCVAASSTSGSKVRVHSINLNESVEIDLRQLPESGRSHWSDYVFGVIAKLVVAGYGVRGADLMIHSTVPLGSGLSSSAALEVATALSTLAMSNLRASPLEVALLCQQAENEFVGARVGIMDQLTSCVGRAGHALLIDCRNLAIQHVPLSAQWAMVVCNTMVRHNLASGEYNIRRQECESSVAILAAQTQIRALRDLSAAELERHKSALDETLYRRCRHVVTENERVLEAASALERGDAIRVGQLMNASHRSLRDDYEVSCRELDIAVEIAISQEGVFGSRMMGGGFGGCTISLIDGNRVSAVVSALRTTYLEQTGITPEVYVCKASTGASEEFG